LEKYEDILNYVVANDFVFFALTCGIGFRVPPTRQRIDRRRRSIQYARASYTTALFVFVCSLVVINTLYTNPAVYGFMSVGAMVSAIPVYYFWKWYNKLPRARSAGPDAPGNP
jgi:hypothetical protein